MQFDYEEFLYDWFESGEADLPPLESLVVRNIKMTATGSKFDSCKSDKMILEILLHKGSQYTAAYVIKA